MATLKSNVYYGGNKFRPVSQEPFEVSATIKLAVGQQLAASDVLKFFKIGKNVDVQNITVRTSDLDDGTNMTFDVGTDSVVDMFIDGSTLPQGGGILSVDAGVFDSQFTPSTTTEYDIQITVLGTATQTTVDDAVRYITLTATLLPSPNATLVGYPYTYEDVYNSSGSSQGALDLG